ncbi:hypothetical protein DHD80_04880 [Gramella sp. AN32]|nr:hypothetical protein [Gramella sp. AN32]
MDEVSLVPEDVSSDLTTVDLKMGIHFETWQGQIKRLEQKTQRFHNFRVGLAQGWELQVTEHVPGMGIHYLNPKYADGIFELEKPEALMYISTEEGKMQFAGVEYLIFGIPPEGPAPEGFIGDQDEWHYNPDVPAWTLHVWVGLENLDGVFAATNPDVD